MPGIDLNYFIRQANKLTEKIEQRKQELANETVEAKSGEGRVTSLLATLIVSAPVSTTSVVIVWYAVRLGSPTENDAASTLTPEVAPVRNSWCAPSSVFAGMVTVFATLLVAPAASEVTLRLPSDTSPAV